MPDIRELFASLSPPRVAHEPRSAESDRPVRPSPAALVRFAGWTLDLMSRQLSAPGGRTTHLPGTEFALLLAFLRHPGQVLGRSDLQARLRGTCRHTTLRTVDVYVSRLRRRMHGSRKFTHAIRTRHGEGYVLDATPMFE